MRKSRPGVASALRRAGASALVLAAIAVAAAGSPAGASTPRVPTASALYLPRLEVVASPAELLLLNEAMEMSADVRSHGEAVAVLDRLLRKAAEPTAFRGMIQLIRADLLSGLGRSPEAIDAIGDSVRLLQGYSAPLISAASIHAYANQPAKAADFLLRAAELDAESVRSLEDYEVWAVLSGLAYAGEQSRLEAVSDRLLQIGWVGSRLASQSGLAHEAIERRLKDGNLEGARALVPRLLAPGDSYSLLTRREFIAVWPDIERWAGPRLANQWAIYLREARERWKASKSVDTVQDYLGALLDAGHHASILRDIYPMLMGKLDQYKDQDLIFVINGVAFALAAKGRWADADALFERTQKVWPLESQPNAINIAGNRARYLFFDGNSEPALRYIDLAIAEAIKKRVNPSALTAMHYYRACILHKLGRTAEADAASALALGRALPEIAANLHLCRGNQAAAKRALLQALKDPERREHVIAFMQPGDDQLLPSDFSREMVARRTALKSDAELRSAVEEHGRILSFALNEAAPPDS